MQALSSPHLLGYETASRNHTRIDTALTGVHTFQASDRLLYETFYAGL